jgi:DNA-binding protein Fis
MRALKQQSVTELIEKHLLNGDSCAEIIDRFRNSVIAYAMGHCDGNITRAAKLLKIHRNSIIRWMKKYNVKAEVFRERTSLAAEPDDAAPSRLEPQNSVMGSEGRRNRSSGTSL